VEERQERLDCNSKELADDFKKLQGFQKRLED
jgi:hypothetical protein